MNSDTDKDFEVATKPSRADKKSQRRFVKRVADVVTPDNYYTTDSPRSYHWKRWQINTAFYVLCVYLLIYVIFLPIVVGNFNLESGFGALNAKPGSVFDEMTQTYDSSTTAANRTITLTNDQITNMSEAEVKELAYAMYQMGNIGMMVSDGSGIYSKGTCDMTMLGSLLPLEFTVIDIRNNTVGEAYRYRTQTTNSSVDTSTMSPLVSIMLNFSVSAERRYYKAGYNSQPLVIYQKGTADDIFNPVFDAWTYAENADLKDRYDRTVNPFPYVAAAYKGDEDLTGVEYGTRKMTYTKLSDFANLSSLKVGTQNYADIFGAVGNTLVPVYTDCADRREVFDGRQISYEKTDQHVYYSQTVETEYNNIKAASVKYTGETKSGQNDGYYTVNISLECPDSDHLSDNTYTSIDTTWAIRDSQAAGTAYANFTRIDIEFQLWDNGYFKQWKMFEDWYTASAKRGGISLGEMSASQEYLELFTYDTTDCDLSTREDFWSDRLQA